MINKGIIFADDKDVLVLKSGVKVTSGWLDKIVSCAYSDDGIGTVSPLSNNAGLCSVPISNQNNPLPSNMDIDEYALEIERVSLKCYQEIPVGNPFCMFIKRSVLSEVGLFDVEMSEFDDYVIRDFCNRASELGYRHVMCDNTFVYNKSTDFVQAQTDTFLMNRYPVLEQKYGNFLAYKQNGVVHRNIDIYYQLNLNKNKKNLFYLIQADFRADASNNIGGTQLHVKDLMEGLREEYNIFVAARDGENLRVTAYGDQSEVSFIFYMGEMEPYYVFRNKKIFDLYSDLLLAFKIDLVHIHHTMGMTHEIYYAAGKHNIPIYLTLHDYYYICPTLRLLDNEKKSCIGNGDTEKCRNCVSSLMPIYDGVEFMPKWRKEHRNVLNMCQKIIIPTRSAAEVILQYYPEIADKMQVIPHGIDSSLFYKEENKKPYEHDELRIAFVGGISETKGSELIYKMLVNSPDKYKWYIMGGIDGELNYLKQDNLVKTGWYKREELKHLLNVHEIDIVCILSKVAETYCYTLSEVVACGVPVIVTDIGALGERMKDMQCGWIVPNDADYKLLDELFSHIRNDAREYFEKYTHTQKYNVRTSKEMVPEYEKLYSDIKKMEFEITTYDTQKILEGYNNYISSKKAYVEAEEYVAMNEQIEQNVEVPFDEYAESTLFFKRELKKIYDSKWFKMIRKVSQALKKIKSMIK